MTLSGNRNRLRQALTSTSSTLVIMGMLMNPAAVTWAQPAGVAQSPSLPAGSAILNAGPAQASADPPALVGRLASLHGTVSFRAGSDAPWDVAALNNPVSPGDAIWTEPLSQASFDVSTIHVALAPQTEFEVTALDDTLVAATQAVGETFLRIDDLPPGTQVAVTIPGATVTITAIGQYDVAAGDSSHPGSVTVLAGAAHLGGAGLSANVGAHQTATIPSGAPAETSVGAEQDSAFLQAQRRVPPPVPTPGTHYLPPPTVRRMTGVDALMVTGTWAPTATDGEIWYPPVQSDWVPYRQGHWSWVAPWGWTWVDDEPWGFATSHYGRWTRIGERWGWVPLEGSTPVSARPVYAPAVVRFVGLAAAAAAGAAVVGAAVGWIPLGPREPYYPPYHVSDGYFHRLNADSVRNVSQLRNVQPGGDINRAPPTLVNRAAATFVPPDSMTRSETVAQHLQTVPQRDLPAIRPVGQLPVRPTLATAGVTPNVARLLDLRPAPGEAALPRPAAPGPMAHPPLVSPASATPGARIARPGPPSRGQLAIGAIPGAGLRAPAAAAAPGVATSPIAPEATRSPIAPEATRSSIVPGVARPPGTPDIPRPRVITQPVAPKAASAPAALEPPPAVARPVEPPHIVEAPKRVETPPAVARPVEPPHIVEAPKRVEPPPAVARPVEPPHIVEAPKRVEPPLSVARPVEPPRVVEPPRKVEPPSPLAHTVEPPHAAPAPPPRLIEHAAPAARPPEPPRAEVVHPAPPPAAAHPATPPAAAQRPGQP